MKLTDITTSLELAKELKEVGFPQESLFSWVKKVSALDYGNALKEKGKWVDDPKGGKSLVCKTKDLDNYGTWKLLDNDDENCKDSGWGYYSAPTAEELLEWLPAYINKKQGLWLSLEKVDTTSKKMKYKASYGDEGVSHIERFSDKPANALAKMVIYLAKNKIIKFER